MLHIHVNNGQNRPSGYVYKVSQYFDAAYEPEWLHNDFVRRVIEGVDRNTIIGEGATSAFYSEVLGVIPPQYLSTGCKNLILLAVEGIKTDGDKLGDNCVPYLLELAESKDVYITTSHLIKFPDNFSAILDNDGTAIRGMKDFLHVEVSYAHEGEN